MGDELKEVLVKDMYYGCMYEVPTEEPNTTRRCLRLAETTVRFSDGDISWRCAHHHGLTQGDSIGPAHDTMITNLELSEELIVSRPHREG